MRRIRLFGVRSNAGIGVHSQALYRNLLRFGQDLLLVEFFNHALINEVEAAIANSRKEDINIYFFPEAFASRLKGLSIYYAVFESNRPRPGYERWLEDFDYIFSPSSWGKGCMINYGLPEERIFVVPEGVDPFVFHPYGRDVDRQGRPTRILMIGKYESRKGYAEALEAFRIVCQSVSNLELWLKPDWISPQGSAMHPEFVALAQRYVGLPIRLVSGHLTQSQMATLYRESDFFLFPSRCEGWGLPLIEAIASGLPAICCDFGGQSEFLAPISRMHISVPYDLEAIGCPDWHRLYPHADGNHGEWAKIDPERLAECIVEAVGSPFLKAAGIMAGDIVRSRFSWERSSDAFVNCLARLNAI